MPAMPAVPSSPLPDPSQPGVAATPHPANWQGPALAMAGAIAFSGKAIIVKLAYRHGVDAVTLIMLRMAVALPFFVAMAWWAGRGRPALSWRDRRACALLGLLGYYLSSLLDFMGLQHISASLERLILYLTPAMVLLLSARLYGKTASKRQWQAMALGYGGMLLVFGHELRLDGPRVALGASLVLASTLSYAAYLTYSGEVVQRIGALRLAGWASGVACALCLLHYALALPLATVLAVAPAVGWLSLLNGTLCTVLPVWLVMAAIERLGSSRAAQYGMVGPISTILMGVAILGEPFTLWIAAGTAGVLAGVMLLASGR
jgi:drug/metabolite transporter (DMT)-like permease